MEEGRRYVCERVNSGEVCDGSQSVVGMSFLLLPNCDTRNGKYFIGGSRSRSQHLQTLSVVLPCRPQLGDWQAWLASWPGLACFREERELRADDDCPPQRQHL